jgi:hypothetical protein
MNLTLDEIATHRARLREEIMEREILLAAFDVVEKYAASGHGPNSMQLGSLVSALLPSQPAVEGKETPASATPNAPSSPPQPRAAPYIHPELKAFGRSYPVNNGTFVQWAIARMTEDYSLRDIAAMLKREGNPMSPEKISVVLSRFKSRGEIEEIRPGGGRTPAIYRAPSGPGGMEPAPAVLTTRIAFAAIPAE